jgi:peroxiredoxin
MKRALEGEKLFLDNGEMFGEAGRGYQRINLACARETLERAMQYFKTAVEKVYSSWEEKGKPAHTTLKVGDKIDDFAYDTAKKSGLELSKNLKRPTLIAFLRFAECDITKAMVDVLKRNCKLLKMAGMDLKVVVQSCAGDVNAVYKDCSFDIIVDPDGKLYDRFNVFESNSAIQLVAGDESFARLIGGDIRHLYDDDRFDTFAPLLLGGVDFGEHRVLQLPAFFVVDKDMTVRYAHYSKTIGDMPSAKDILASLKK